MQFIKKRSSRMKRYQNYLLVAICVISNLYTTITFASDATRHHVICSLKNSPTTKITKRLCNESIHDATYDINLACKKLYVDDIEHNDFYQYHRNTVFIVHMHHNFNSWTLYKPSFIPYNQFVKLVKKIYGQYGLQVICNHDSIVNITSCPTGAQFLTLDEFEKYKKITPEELDSVSQEVDPAKFELYENIKKMQKYFFWHLQIPTTGLYHDDRFDIPDKYKPLAWHYGLWDLAPKKGLGARVALIDTGVSAFSLEDKNFQSFYKKNINLTAANNLLDYGYNLISKNGLDPIRQIQINLANFCDHQKFDSYDCMEQLPEMIIDIVRNQNSLPFEQYFAKYAKNRYLESDKKTLNQEGKGVLKDLVYGKYGIAPSGKDSFFHIAYLDKPYEEFAIVETLPAPQINNNESPSSAGHGTFTQGIINGKLYQEQGITGLAPQAEVTMIKAFHDNGRTNKTTLTAALQRAVTLKNPIVSMSLKITDEFDKSKDAPLKELIDSIDYVVAASGNDGQSQKLKNKEAYPAKFDSVAFDVGAFSFQDNKYPVCAFTQKELPIGPKFVAPGMNIFSSGLVSDQTEDSMYVFMSGTSIAVPIITGFIALVTAEFQDDFTREELLKVIYKFSIKLGNDEIWQNYIKLGTPDMRSVLLCLHVLKSLKHYLQEHPNKNYTFAKNFDAFVQAIYTINYYTPSQYEAITKCSLTQDLAQYTRIIKEKGDTVSVSPWFTPQAQNLDTCVQAIQNVILQAINENTKSLEGLAELVKKIMSQAKLNLFANLAQQAQDRVTKALTPRKTCLVS